MSLSISLLTERIDREQKLDFGDDYFVWSEGIEGRNRQFKNDKMIEG